VYFVCGAEIIPCQNDEQGALTVKNFKDSPEISTVQCNTVGEGRVDCMLRIDRDDVTSATTLRQQSDVYNYRTLPIITSVWTATDSQCDTVFGSEESGSLEERCLHNNENPNWSGCAVRNCPTKGGDTITISGTAWSPVRIEPCTK